MYMALVNQIKDVAYDALSSELNKLFSSLVQHYVQSNAGAKSSMEETVAVF